MLRLIRLLVLLAVVIAGSAGCRDDQKATIPTGLQTPPKEKPNWGGYGGKTEKPPPGR
jgi:hypothetical protein